MDDIDRKVCLLPKITTIMAKCGHFDVKKGQLRRHKYKMKFNITERHMRLSGEGDQGVQSPFEQDPGK